MKRIKNYIIIFIILLLYVAINKIFDFYIPCPIYSITGLHCPGCGVTRMIYSIFKLDFYQAFRYNPLLFITMPFFLFFIINDIYSKIKNKESLYKKVPEFIWIIVIAIFMIFGILRNIFPYLAPTEI